MTGTWVEDNRNSRAIPSLVNSCQRVLAANIDSITGFGDGIPYRLVRPILQGCNAETLLRLERESPSLQERTSDLWRDVCGRAYSTSVDQILNSTREEPVSWRDEFFSMKRKEAIRLEEAASKLRNQRIEAEGLKRKRQVKLTDQLPPAKRPRSGCPATPKTLFQKTRKEATKIQKNFFGSRILPPATGNSKVFRPKVASASMTENGDSVVINTITVRKASSDSSAFRPGHSR